ILLHPTLLSPFSPLFPYTTLFRSVSPPQNTSPKPAAFITGNRSRQPGLRACCPVRKHRCRRHRESSRARRAVRPHNDPRHWVLRSEEHTSELQSRFDLVCRLLLEK